LQWKPRKENKVNVGQVLLLASGNILTQLETQNGFPILDEHFQSNIPGLFFTSMCATQDFGPFFVIHRSRPDFRQVNQSRAGRVTDYRQSNQSCCIMEVALLACKQLMQEARRLLDDARADTTSRLLTDTMNDNVAEMLIKLFRMLEALEWQSLAKAQKA
jgi:hypothetical protein